MQIWFLVGPYALVAIASMRPVAGHLAWSMNRNDPVREYRERDGRFDPTGEQWFGAWCMAALAGPVWPVLLVFALVGRLTPAIGAERAAKLDAAERRIRALERELGVTR